MIPSPALPLWISLLAALAFAVPLPAPLSGPLSVVGPGGDPSAGARSWPVGGGTGGATGGRPVVERGFEPPASPWGSGHRGVDLRAGPGAPVRSAALGRVAFAGPVAGVDVVSILLPDGLRTTYEPVRALVAVGDEVAAGQVVGVLEGGPWHCPAGCLHWGLLRGDVYLDPLTLLPEWMKRGGRSRLLPVFGVPVPGGGVTTVPSAPAVPVVPRTRPGPVLRAGP